MKKNCPLPEVMEKLDEGITSIRRSVVINRTIYCLTLIIVIWLAYKSYQVREEQVEQRVIIMKNLERSIETKAKLDASDTLYMNYIKDTVGQILDKLQKDNPQLIVPKAPAPRPQGLPPPKESDLERPRSERPTITPTPSPKVITKTKRIYVRKPKDWPWWKLWPPK